MLDGWLLFLNIYIYCSLNKSVEYIIFMFHHRLMPWFCTLLLSKFEYHIFYTQSSISSTSKKYHISLNIDWLKQNATNCRRALPLFTKELSPSIVLISSHQKKDHIEAFLLRAWREPFTILMNITKLTLPEIHLDFNKCFENHFLVKLILH